MVFAIFKQLAAGVDVSGGEATVQFLQLSLGGPAWGVGAGLVTSYMMRLHVSDSPLAFWRSLPRRISFRNFPPTFPRVVRRLFTVTL